MGEPNKLEKAPELLQDLYSEVYELVRLELNHSALSMMSVLLEATLKELIKKKRGKYPDGASFGKSIQLCLNEKTITESEATWLKRFNYMVRNSYLHHDVEKLAKNMKLKPETLKGTTKKDFDRLVAVELFADVDKFFREVIVRVF